MMSVLLTLSLIVAGWTLPVRLASSSSAPTALVLYDTTGNWGSLGELYALQVANLTGHFGGYEAHAVSAYKTGEIAQHAATVYVGSTYDEPLPSGFLDDVLASSQPVIWINDNIWQLAARAGDFAGRYGWSPAQFDTSTSPVTSVSYGTRSVNRSSLNNAPLMTYGAIDATKAKVLATAKRADGTTLPWAVRSGALTYVGENPFTYVSENDRQLIFADLLFDALTPSTPARHRATVRLEDIGPDSNATEVLAAAQYLYGQGVPYSFAVYPAYRDPLGAKSNGVAQSYGLADRPEIVSAIQYMLTHGGTMIMHGYTHQYSNVANPYSGVSAEDFEFYRAHLDKTSGAVVWDGAVPGDSQQWAVDRINASVAEFQRAGLQVPQIFEFPHYAASAADYAAVAFKFSTRYERSMYYQGTFTHTSSATSAYVGQMFPYVVRDVYGMTVLPEDLGNYEPTAESGNVARSASEIIANAAANLVVRDNVAGFFYHPYYGVDNLKATVEGIRALGYSFVAPSALETPPVATSGGTTTSTGATGSTTTTTTAVPPATDTPSPELDVVPQTTPRQIPSEHHDAHDAGYWLAGSDGGVYTFGAHSFFGSAGGMQLSRPVVDMCALDSGYWLVADDGGVFSYGSAMFHGSMGGTHLNQPIVGMDATNAGGYWLVARDGGVFAFGNAKFRGSMGGVHLNAAITGMVATPSANGYWLAAKDGGVFAFGDAKFFGSMGGQHLQSPIVGIAVTPSGNGYWLVAADGGVFAFGDAKFFGSMGGHALRSPIVGMKSSSDGGGYQLVAVDGGVFAFGDAHFDGSLGGMHVTHPIVAMS